MNNLRLRIWRKIAQETVPEDLPSQEVSETKVVSGSPPSFIATGAYPSIIIGFQSKNTPFINGLSNLINQALYYSSDGKVHLPWMRSITFNFTSDNTPSVDLKNLMDFSKLIFKTIFTDQGVDFKQQLSAEEIAQRVNILKNSSSFVNLPTTTNSASQLGVKIGGNLKALINNYLLQIK